MNKYVFLSLPWCRPILYGIDPNKFKEKPVGKVRLAELMVLLAYALCVDVTCSLHAKSMEKQIEWSAEPGSMAAGVKDLCG